jgi:hypothetical protein
MAMASDIVVETLIAVQREVAPELDEDLVRACYEIQKKHQFDRDRGVPTQAMDRLIDNRANVLAVGVPLKASRA